MSGDDGLPPTREMPRVGAHRREREERRLRVIMASAAAALVVGAVVLWAFVSSTDQVAAVPAAPPTAQGTPPAAPTRVAVLPSQAVAPTMKETKADAKGS